MNKDDMKDLFLESYLKGQEDFLKMLILATKKYKEVTGKNYLKVDEALNVYDDWLERVMEKHKE